MKTLWFIFWVLLTAHAQADFFHKGDKVVLTRDIPLLFNDTVYREALKAEQFTVYIYKPEEHKVYILTQDTQGQTIALNIPDNALALATSISSSLPTNVPAGSISEPSGVASFLSVKNDEKGDMPLQGKLVIAIIVLLFMWGIMKMLSDKAKAKTRSEQKKKEAVNFWNSFEVGGYHTLPQVNTRVFLKSGEYAVYEEPAKLFESRAVRNYGSGMVGIRVAKGVWIGGSKGRSVSTQQLKEIDSGVLTVTNKRIVFEGNTESRIAELKKIAGTNGYSDAVEIHLENRQKALLFTADNPILLEGIIRYSTTMDGVEINADFPKNSDRRSSSRVRATIKSAPLRDEQLEEHILAVVQQEGESGVDVALLARRLEQDPEHISEWIKNHPEKLRQVGEGPDATFLVR